MEVVKVEDSYAELKFGPAEGDPTSNFEYYAVLDPVSDTNMYGKCMKREEVNIESAWGAYNLMPATTYHFRPSACHRSSLRCTEAEPITLKTLDPGVKLKQPTDVTQTRALVNWQVLYNGEEEVSYVWVYAVPVDEKLPQQQCAVKNKQGCTLEHLRPDTEYYLMVKACESAGYCAALNNQAKIRTAKPYILESPRDAKVTNVQATSFSLIWAKPVADKHNSFEYKVSLKTPDDPSIPESSFICETTLANGNEICQIKNLHTNYSYSVTLSVCAKMDMCSNAGAPIIGKTAIKAPVQEILGELAKEITQASATPTDATSQLMIRVSYSKLTAPEIGNLNGVSVVITPVEDSGTSDGPNWSSSFIYSATSAKMPQIVGGTYIDPIDGSWELRLPMPEAATDSGLPDENVLLGAGLGTMIDSHDYNGRLAAGTTFVIQLRVYTDLGVGTTASTKMSTEGKLTDSDPYGNVIAIAVVLAVLCGLLIALVILLVAIVRGNRTQMSRSANRQMNDE
nr:unnamed protein product [Spirometra erinaceieuropaei]